MLALFGSLAPLELGLILIAAIMIFGRDLPRVAAQLFAQLAKVKKAMRDMWRETGMEEEMRRVRNELDDAKLALPSVESLDPRTKARELARDLDVQMREIPEGPSEFPSAKKSSGQKASTQQAAIPNAGDEDAAEGQAATPPLSQEELRQRAEDAEAEASRRAAEAQAKLRAKQNRPDEPEGELERRA